MTALAEPEPEHVKATRADGAPSGAPRGTARQLETPPPRGVRIDEAPGIFRVVAANPGPMTYHGTNTWFVETSPGALAVIDPGPNDPDHLEAVLRAGDGRISHILLSHAHPDHRGNADPLARALGLPIHGHALLAKQLDSPLIALGDNDRVAGLTALHTPGHAQDHLCFAWHEGILFTADHVMGWSTSVVPPPPLGDAGDYLASLRRLLDRDDRIYFCGHGPAVTRPHFLVSALLAQRQRREREVARLLVAGPATVEGITAALYPALRPGLDLAARANVAGLLAKLAADGEAATDGQTWRHVPPEPATAD